MECVSSKEGGVVLREKRGLKNVGGLIVSNSIDLSVVDIQTALVGMDGRMLGKTCNQVNRCYDQI